MSENRVSIKKNLAYQSVYQILITCLPLIVSPYLSRILGATQLGVFSFTSSIVSYFMLFAMLGTSNFGTRNIAACGSDKDKRSQTFWSVYWLQFIVSLLSIVLYFTYVYFICTENRLISIIQIITLISCMLDINWLYFGLENFKLTVTWNMVIRILTVCSILILVKKPEDVWIYALITGIGTLVSQAVLWRYIKNVIYFVKVPFKEVLNNIKPNLMLFIPLLAMSIYHTMDKTMLGIMSTYQQSGFYYNVDKVINIPVGIISGISTVMLPRMTSLISLGKRNKANELFRISLEGTVWIGVAISFGIAAIAAEFEPIFFGPGYTECILLTIVLAPVFIIKSFSFTARYQYLIPHHKEKDFTASVIAGAVVNLIVNSFLIPRLGAMGAVIGTVIAELTACIWQYVIVNKMIKLKKVITNCIIYLIIGIFMFATVRFVSQIGLNIYFKLVIEIISGFLAYIICSILYWKISRNSMYKIMFNTFIK